MNDWLKNLKVGDNVIIDSRHGSSVTKVERFTKTQIVLKNNYKFNRTTGYEVGGDTWNTVSISPATFERLCQITLEKKKDVLVSKIIKRTYHSKLASLSIESLETIAKILEAK